ncbi:MAG: 2-amino-4-hydroxy-6-hydroxymethyldihydropteridine diphosphokinase [Gammaproteobacteria bacterium]|nr:MAG: 2-amino-4-hydroxy-6-hydroxymethyldihydropteridine diphosphokinase [Gammaproteobacteria bacterium]RLA54135.1 MAG: 2-amino-4-hydroxy-6-hydroxymethyldihydropteridine diphosphokinase [Gammaproteobacteria bacterium]
MRTEVYIALGSNLNSPPRQVQRAISSLARLPETKLIHTAPWYRSRAIGPGKQADYINTVVSIATALTPRQLLRELQAIENQQGRKRVVRWGPRSIDLDILLFGKRTIKSKILTIPHPHLTRRNFVIYPLADIAPDLVLPDTTSVQKLLANTCAEGIVRLKAGETLGSTG